MENRILTVREYIAMAMLVLAVFIPAFFQFGNETIVLFSVFWLCGIAFYLTRKELLLPRFFWTIMLGVLLLWNLAHVFIFSINPYQSFQQVLQLISAGILWLLAVTLFQKRQLQEFFSYLLLVGTLILIALGFYFFWNTENYGYLRMVSTFYYHNALGGFLVLPLFLGLWLLFKPKMQGNAFIFLFLVFMVTSFFLTFSRGSFLSAGIGLFFFLAWIWKNHSASQFLKKTLLILTIFMLGGVVAYGLFAAKARQAVQEGAASASSPYEAEQAGETGFLSRVHYMRDAITLVKEKPFSGFGLGSFGNEYRRIQTDVRFYSTDPHNVYLKFFVESGLVGGLGFLILIVGTLALGMRRLFSPLADMHYAAYFSGFLALSLHLGANTDFRFLAIVYLLFISAAFFINSVDMKHVYFAGKNIWVPGIAIAGVSAAIIFTFLLGEIYYKNSIAAISENKEEDFLKNINQAVFFDRFNPLLKLRSANLFILRGDNDRAGGLLLEAQRRNQRERDIWLSLAVVAQREGKYGEAEKYFKTVLDLAPYRDLLPVTGLVEIFLQTNRKEEAKIIIEEALKRFPSESFSSSLWIDPRKPKVKEDRETLIKVLKELKKNGG